MTNQSLQNNENKCFICQDIKSNVVYEQDKNIVSYQCPHCGYYTITTDLIHDLQYLPKQFEDFRKRAPAIAAERRLRKMDQYILSAGPKYEVFVNHDHLFLDEYPKDFFSKYNRALCNLGRYLEMSPLKKIPDYIESFQRYIFCEDAQSGRELLKLFESDGFIYLNIPRITGKIPHITMAGLREIRKLLASESPRNANVFIAMWFDDKTKPILQPIKQAVTEAGYDEPHTVAEIPHNDFIMDKVLNSIKESRFVIADLTTEPEIPCGDSFNKGIRGGVYFEAGYAKGLNIPVIYTCSEDSMNRRHFDVGQINTIVWRNDNGNIMTDNSELADRLREHIIATIGKGPHYKKHK